MSSSFQWCIICGVWHDSGMIWRPYVGNVEVMTDRQTDRQTNRISTCRLDPSGRRGRVKTMSMKSNNLASKLPQQRSYMLPLMTNSCSPFSGLKEILSIYASICRFWAIWYIVTSYNTMHVAERYFVAGSIRLWKFFTTLPEGTRLLDFWVHYPTLPYPKLKNHYPSGPAPQCPGLHKSLNPTIRDTST